MRTTIRSAVLLLMMTTPALAAGLYRCDAKDAVSLQDDGTLGRDKVAESSRNKYEKIIVDTATGAMRVGDDTPQIWTILSKGGPDNDFVAAAMPYHDPSQGVSESIRVRAWTGMETVLFVWHGLSVVSGTCEPIH